MTIRSLICLASRFCLSAVILAPIGRADVFNAVTDFSITNNPNGVWSYQVAGTLYPVSDGFLGPCGTVPNECLTWYNGLPVPDAAFIVKNISPFDLAGNSTVFIPPNYLEIDPEGLNVAVVFTAPATGFYQVAGQFIGNDTLANPHPVSVTQNGTTSLFSSSILSYLQKDPFDLMVNLNAGDTIAFDVATGSTGCSFCDLSTGLWTEITTTTDPIMIPVPITDTGAAIMPEPEMMPLLGAGIAGLALLRLRRKR